jgi:uncharacterized membrane protein YqgA involved in biofilm formation
MLGTLLNVGGIVLGGLVGLTVGHRISPSIQGRIRVGLAGLIVYAGLSMVWAGFHGPWHHALKQLGIGLLSLILGNLLGRGMRLQRTIDRMGRWAANRFSAAQAADPTAVRKDLDPRRWSEGFVTCTLIFCVGPMAILGSIQDGLDGQWKTLAIKGILDGLATLGFTATYGWGPILSAIPVLAYQGSLTLAAQWMEPLIRGDEMKASLGIAGGLIVACIAVVILNLRKVPLADYLPALVVAPALTKWWLA